jgi:hypothetical protein
MCARGCKGGVLTRLVWDEGVEGWVPVMGERGEGGGRRVVAEGLEGQNGGGEDGVVINSIDAGGQLTVSELSALPGLSFSVWRAEWSGTTGFISVHGVTGTESGLELG